MWNVCYNLQENCEKHNYMKRVQKNYFGIFLSASDYYHSELWRPTLPEADFEIWILVVTMKISRKLLLTCYVWEYMKNKICIAVCTSFYPDCNYFYSNAYSLSIDSNLLLPKYFLLNLILVVSMSSLQENQTFRSLTNPCQLFLSILCHFIFSLNFSFFDVPVSSFDKFCLKRPRST